jgi:hypothetical protein
MIEALAKSKSDVKSKEVVNVYEWLPTEGVGV